MPGFCFLEMLPLVPGSLCYRSDDAGPSSILRSSSSQLGCFFHLPKSLWPLSSGTQRQRFELRRTRSGLTSALRSAFAETWWGHVDVSFIARGTLTSSADEVDG